MTLILVALLAAAPAPVPSPPALRLPSGARPLRQAIDLTIQPSQQSFSGLTEIEIELGKATSFLWLNGRGLKVKEATARLGTETLTLRPETGGEDFLGFAFPRPVGPGRITLRIAYDGIVDRKDTLGLFGQQEAGDWYAFTQFEATGARRAIPSFDEPSYKIPWTVTLRVPKELVALSNAPEASSQADREGLKTVRFAETPPMPSYLVALAVGPFELVDAGRVGRKAVPARIVTPRGRAAEARWAAEATPHIVRLLEEYFDRPYPYAKLDQVAVPITVGFGAMENAGLVTYGQGGLLRKPDEESIGFRRGFARTSAHELAHMWFGDLVTAAWWDDIWLNEAFANWTEAKVIDRWKPEWDGQVGRVFSRSGAMSQDSRATARKIRQPIQSEHDIENAFDGITYEKGEAVLSMFESWLGEEPFRRGVIQYLKSYEWKNATAADFLGALGAASGQDVAGAVSTFLDQNGVPLVTARLMCSDGPPRLLLSQKPYRLVGAPEGPTKSWSIPVCARYGGESPGRACTMLSAPTGELPLGQSPICPTWVLPNERGTGYYRVAYGSDLLQRLLRDGGKALSLPERVSVLDDLAAAVRSGDVKAAEALAVVPVMLKDPSRHLAAATATLVSTATGNILPEEARPRLAHFVREMYEERARALGWTPKPGEDDDTRLLRQTLVSTVAFQGEDPELGTEALRLTQRFLEDPKAIDPDLIGAVLRAATRTGDRALFERLRDAARQAPERLQRRRLLGALGGFRDPALVPEVFALAFDEKLDPRETMGFAFSAGGGEPKNRKLVWELFKQRFDPLVARVPREALGNLPFAAAGFCDPEARKDVDAFFRPRIAQFVGGPRNLDQVLEGIDLCIAYRDAQQASLVEFLQKY
jgi:alanyl aminopeptidase